MYFNLIVVAIIVGALFLVIYKFLSDNSQTHSEANVESTKKVKSFSNKTTTVQPTTKKLEKNFKNLKDDKKFKFSHKWLINSMKGHTTNITDFDISSSCKYLASIGSNFDRSIYLWSIKDLKQPEIKLSRCSVESHSPDLIVFSPDDKAVITNLSHSNKMRIFKLVRKPVDSAKLSANLSTHTLSAHTELELDSAGASSVVASPIVNIGIASNGRWMMTYHAGTAFRVWTLKGELLETVSDTGHVINYCAAVSPCARFVATAGFSPDTKIWEVVCDKKSGEFRSVRRAFELKGHHSGVVALCYSADSTRMATVSKDGTCKFWKVDVEFEKQEDATCLLTIPLQTVLRNNNNSDGGDDHEDEANGFVVGGGECTALNGTSTNAGDGEVADKFGICLAINAENRVLCLAFRTNLYFFSLLPTSSSSLSSSSPGNALLGMIEGAHSDSICKLKFFGSSLDECVVSAGGRQIHVFANVPGMRLCADKMEEKLRLGSSRANTSGLSKLELQRIQEDLAELRSKIERFESS